MILIGTGPMAISYAEVFKALNVDFEVIGRGEASAHNFETLTGIKPFVGGIHHYLDTHTLDRKTSVVIATGTESLMPAMLLLLSAGAGKILIEKPAALSIDELLDNEPNIRPFSDRIFVAYNRRFYSSVAEARKIIEEDGGLLSMHFEFTEWAHRIEPLEKAEGVKENWFFANSTHVIDLAFFLAGKPTDWQAFSKPGKLKWHDKTNFAGAGITEKGTLFSYISNWESAGRWSIELLTGARRIYLKPMENIFVQMKGSIEIGMHDFDNAIDIEFKPGIYRQVNAFINNDITDLQSIEEHIDNTRNIYRKIIN